MVPKKITTKKLNPAFNGTKKNLIRYSLILEDLNKIEKIIGVIKSNITNEDLVEALTIQSVVTYGRSFNSDYGQNLNREIFEHDVSKIDSSKGQCTEREFHKLLMNYRNKHLAHTDKLLIDGDIGIFLENDNFVCLTSSRKPVENIQFYDNFLKLISKCKAESIKLRDSNFKVLESLRSQGDIEASHLDLQLVPIKADITARAYWGID